MAVLKCTVCGGELEVNADMSVGVCKYCDSVITIPKEIDRKGRLYNRAVFLRQNNEFDKAMATYEDILKEDNKDADAHWGLVLSKFGIEYITDPKTQERVPTCHRVQSVPILSDPDYLAALEYADAAARDVIEKEAQRIHEIQTKILEISRQESPYDIFICYKESDEAGNRTEDSLLAQELYFELQKKGYKVFFARKTLESKLGAEYEPIIFAALSSAKVMIVLGTRADHFNAVWVRNEWSRFMSMAQTGDKVIIPAYRGMSPYELPAELSALQSQDMSKIGFMQDLTDGIERCLRGSDTKNRAAKESSTAAASLERMLQNAETYLRLGNFKAAEEAYTAVTKEHPEDYRGWWGLIAGKTHNFSDAWPLVAYKADLFYEFVSDQEMTNSWFGYVKKLAEPEKLAELEAQYVEFMRKAAEPKAIDDMSQVNGMMERSQKAIQNVQTLIRQNEKNIQDNNKSTEEDIAEFGKTIEWKQGELKKKEATYAKAKTINTISVVLLVLGCVIILVALAGLAIGWLIGGAVLLAGYLFWRHTTPRSSMKRMREGMKKIQEQELPKLYENQKQSKRRNEERITSLQQQKQEHEAEIADLQRKIAACQAYLDLGKEKIEEFWFSEQCRAIGVEQACDSRTREYRNAAFGVQENAKEDSISVACPGCGYKNTENRSTAMARGYVYCHLCKKRIELSGQ